MEKYFIMAKKVYKIPNNLSTSWLDLEIAVKSDNGVGLAPLPLGTLLAWILSGLICFWAVLNTGIKAGGPVLIALFIILWIALSLLLLRPLKTGGMSFKRAFDLFDYLPKERRNVLTRSSSPATPFYNISAVDSIDEDRGLIHFRDGWVGFVYRVVGSGSVLLFENDRDDILNRVDTFYRNMKTDYELIFVTSREAQQIRSQVDAIDRRISRLGGNPGDDEIIELLKTEKRYLLQEVGGRFRSIHQYLVLRAPNMEALTLGRNMLANEVESSTLMFKRVTALFDQDLHDFFAKVYRGKESI